jgi:cation diffusion facilitator family transporter
LTELANRKTSTAVLSVLSNSVLIILKVVVGVLIGSVAVLSEAIHSGVDLIAALIAFLAVRASGRAADERHPYGHGKYENISGTIEALLIFVAAIWIIYEAVRKLISPQPIDTPAWGVVVMLISAIVNSLVSRRLFKVGKATDSVALQADAWHLRTDVYTSVGVMVGLLVIWIVNLISPGIDIQWLDAAIAIVVALMILKAAWDLTRKSARDLLDVSLPEEDVRWIGEYLTGTCPQVRSFHNLRTRKAGSNRFIDFHVAVDDKMSVGEAHALGDEIVLAIKDRLPESHIHIHIEPCDYSCKDSCVNGCSVEDRERG